MKLWSFDMPNDGPTVQSPDDTASPAFNFFTRRQEKDKEKDKEKAGLAFSVRFFSPGI